MLQTDESHELAMAVSRARDTDRELAAALDRPNPSGQVSARFLEELDRRQRLSPERERELVAAAKSGDERARGKLVEAYMPLIGSVARQYRMSPTISRLELMQEGVVGLLQALQRYDPDRGVPFWAYARHYVRRAMQRLVAELSGPVVFSDHALRNLTRIRDAQRKFAEEHHRDPTLRELAEMTGLDVDQVSHLVTFDRPMRPIPDTMNLDDGSIAVEPPDRLSDGEYERVLDAIEAEELVALLSTLSDRERMILRARYGLDGPEQTRQEIAERLGISTARVKEIERRALGKLAAAARAAGAEA